MKFPPYAPPFYLANGLVMTAYAAFRGLHIWEDLMHLPAPPYRDRVWRGENDVPIHSWCALPPNPRGTIIATYGIVGELDNQWFLKILGRKGYGAGYGVILFDWRAHGKTADLSPTLTSDGLFEGRDFVRIAAAAKELGYPAPFWFAGYSLGGQLALWGIEAADTIAAWAPELGDRLAPDDIAGGAVVCPSLDSERSLRELVQTPMGRYIEQKITRQLQHLAERLHRNFPNEIDPGAIARADSIWGFDRELVIGRLGFESVEAYYSASSALPLIPRLQRPTLIFYAADDPLFARALVAELRDASAQNPNIDLVLTDRGGHVGYISSEKCQRQSGDRDPWWAWNRTLEWFDAIAPVQGQPQKKFQEDSTEAAIA